MRLSYKWKIPLATCLRHHFFTQGNTCSNCMSGISSIFILFYFLFYTTCIQNHNATCIQNRNATCLFPVLNCYLIFVCSNIYIIVHYTDFVTHKHINGYPILISCVTYFSCYQHSFCVKLQILRIVDLVF